MVRFKKSKFIILISVLLIAPFLQTRADSKAAAGPIGGAALAAQLAKVVTNEAEREKLVQGYLTEMRAASDALKKKLVSGPTQQYDAVIVGAGPQGIIYAANLKAANPKLKVLIVEAGDTVSSTVWGVMGKSFTMNTPETSTASANVYPNAPTQMSQWMNGRKYPQPQDMRDEMAIMAHASGVDILFGEKAQPITGTSGNYTIALQSGLQVNARETVLATGFGGGRNPFKDPASHKLFDDKGGNRLVKPTDMPDLQFSDDLLQNGSKMTAAKHPPLTDLKGKTIVIIGGGNGGDISAEYLVGQADSSNYIDPTVNFGNGKIIWLGQPLTTGAAYAAAKGDRYKPLAKYFDNGTISTVQGHVTRVERITSGPNAGRLAFYVDSQTDPIIGDKGVSAAGYEDETPALLSKLVPEGSKTVMQPILGKDQSVGGDTSSVPVASRVTIQAADGSVVNHAIQVIGPEARVSFTPEELAGSITHNPVSVNVLAFGTADLAAQDAVTLSASPLEIDPACAKKAVTRDLSL